MKQLPAFLFSIIAVFALPSCKPQYYEAEAKLEGNASATMTVNAMMSLHSDWHRAITVSDGQATATLELIEDTGWWRGSNLYIHSSGVYVVDEGQGGPFAFTLDPVSYDVPIPTSYFKVPNTATRPPLETASFKGYPASIYRSGVFYIGSFVEASAIPELRDARSETPIVFQTHEEATESELPDAL